MNKVKYYDCKWFNCEVLRVEANIFHPEDDCDNEFFFAIYEGSHKKMDMLGRIVHCWNTLIHGKPYGDQVILKKEDAKNLAKFLNDNLEIKE